MKKFSYLLLSILPLACLSDTACAVVPESGVYWNPTEPGRGYVLDYQNGQVALITYAFDGNGAPIWHIASGPLRDDADQVPNLDAPGHPGYLPLTWARADLYRVTGGPCLGCPFTGTEGLISTKVGRASIYFPYLKTPFLEVIPTSPTSGVARTESELLPFNFGRRVFGDITRSANWLVDLEGRWFFEEQSAAKRTWALEFGPAEFRQGLGFAYEVIYRDPAQNAVMRCLEGDQGAEVRLRDGCELTIAGEVQIYAYDLDIGINRMEASLGTFPENIFGPVRYPTRVYGIRLER